MGLREEKKEQTRKLIAGTAGRLFAERGFDDVSIAEVAREARVSQATVYNYFRTKEDLFYWPMEEFGTRLAEAVSARPPGEPAVAAFRGALLAGDGLLAQADAGDAEAGGRLRTVSRLIAGSPALRARERQALDRATAALADVLAADAGAPPGDLRPAVAASALMGVHQALLEHVRRRAAAGEDLTGLAAEVRELADGAFRLLEHGLGDYAVKPDGAGR